jgi:hypothetical protein
MLPHVLQSLYITHKATYDRIFKCTKRHVTPAKIFACTKSRPESLTTLQKVDVNLLNFISTKVEQQRAK